MTQSFRKQFEHYVVPSREIERLAFDSGLIVLDSNVLLSAYRFAPESRDELLSVIERLRDRVWIPHQVGLEFYRNRVQVMADYRSSYGSLLENVRKANIKLVNEVTERINHLANRVLLREEKAELLALLETAVSPLVEAIDSLRKKHEITGSYDDDPILTKLEGLLDGRVGPPLPEDMEQRAKEEAQRRIVNKIPPGFHDADKEEPHGDYFVWAQALEQAKSMSAAVLLLVTSDTKPDWYREINGQVISPQPELAEEAMLKAGCQLVMMDAPRFLKRAKDFGHADVSAETIREAEALPRERISQDQIDYLTKQLHHLHHRHDILDDELRQAEAMHEQIRHEEQTVVRALDGLSRQATEPEKELAKRLADLHQRRDAVTAQRHHISMSVTQLQAEYAHIQASLDEARAELAFLQKHQADAARTEERLSALRAQISTEEARLAKLQLS